MHLKLTLVALVISVSTLFAGTDGKGDIIACDFGNSKPYESWDFGVETGYLWQFGHNTSIDYELATSVFSFRSPVAVHLFEQNNGNALVVRNRASIIADYVVEGPEDYIITLNGSPSIEYWFADDKLAFYLSPGGGIGLSNSKGVSKEGGAGIEGGQGQDFLLNWFVQSGIRYQLDSDTALTVGAMFQHVSNGGQTDVNPGIDAIGFTIGFIKTF